MSTTDSEPVVWLSVRGPEHAAGASAAAGGAGVTLSLDIAECAPADSAMTEGGEPGGPGAYSGRHDDGPLPPLARGPPAGLVAALAAAKARAEAAFADALRPARAPAAAIEAAAEPPAAKRACSAPPESGPPAVG